MNYSADRPIDSVEQDLLGRFSFSNQFGKTIYEYNGKDGLVIGLFGKWGTGKTSVINMATNEISRLAEEDEHKAMIMKFAPWNYSNKDNLISLFFQSLKYKIELPENEKLKKKIGKALYDYSGILDALSHVPVFGSAMATVFKTVVQAQGNNMMQSTDLDTTKEILEEALRSADEKIVVIIDDIDRLTTQQIRDIFQLVKQVADFPNVIYVLAMDRDVVSNALADEHSIDGNEYMEKIIQVAFELPEIRKSKLNDILFERLEEIIKELPGEVMLDGEYWRDVFKNCIEPYINTLRDVNRLINSFQFRYGALHNEVSFEDMVGITAIEIFEPKLYKWILSNKDAVCGGFLHGLSSIDGKKTDYRKLYGDEFTGLGINPDFAINCVSTMFPVFNKDVNEYQYNHPSISDIRGKMRVADEKRFELYFMFALDEIKISRGEINQCIFGLDKENLKKAIEKFNQEGNIVFFIEEIKSLVDTIPDERLGLIASVILDLQGGFEGEGTQSMFVQPAWYVAIYLVEDIMTRMKTEEKRFEVIYTATENVEKNGLKIIATMINIIELAYGKLVADSEKKEKQFVSLEHLEELEKKYVERINDIASSEPIFGLNGFKIAFYLWRCLDKDSAANYVEGLFENEVNKLRFICSIAGEWNGSNGKGWEFTQNDYSEYISEDEVYDEIQRFDKKRLNEFSEIEQIKLASFVLNYNKHNIGYVSEQEAQKLVNDWNREE